MYIMEKQIINLLNYIIKMEVQYWKVYFFVLWFIIRYGYLIIIDDTCIRIFPIWLWTFIIRMFVCSNITALINYIIAMVISPSILALHGGKYCKHIKPHINECHSFENEFHKAVTFDATHQYTALELQHCALSVHVHDSDERNCMTT